MANIGLIGDDELPIGAQVQMRPEPAAPPATPSWGETWAASFRQDNLIGSFWSRKDYGISNDLDPNFHPWEDIKDDPKYRDRWDRFVDVNNPRMMAARKAQIDMEDSDRRTQAASGWRGMLTSLGAGVADPTILVPGAGYIKAVKGGYSVSRAALDVAIGGALGAAAQEVGLQASQETRPWEDSAIAIGSGFVLGGLLGGGARLLTRGEARNADTSFRASHRSADMTATGTGGLIGGELTDIATRVRSGERVPSNEVVEAARIASLQAREGRELSPDVLARAETIDRLAQEVERETIRAKASDIETGVRQSFGRDASRLIDEGGVKVVQSVEDLPARADGTAHPGDVRGMFDGKTAYLVADNVAPDEVKGVLLHEVGVHYGMERMLGKRQFELLAADAFYRAETGEARFAEALAAVPKDTPWEHIQEEMLAYLVERAPEVGIVQRVITAVKQFIREAFGGKITGLGEDDIRALAVSALRKWKPDAGPAEIRYSRQNRSPEVQRSLPDLVSAAKEMASWNDWYERYQGDLKRLFGSDTALIQKMLSATSQATSVPGNVTLALKAYRQYLAGETFDGFLPAVRGNLERIRNDEALRGQKIAEYGKANEGDAEGIAVDRHIAELFFDTKSPNAQQVASAKEMIRSVAAELGWDAKGVQAALWAYNIVRKGGVPQSYDTFLRAKEAEIQALRAKYGRGEGEGVPDGGATGGAYRGAEEASGDAGRNAGPAGDEAADVRYSRAQTQAVADKAPAPIKDALMSGRASVVSDAAIFYSRGGEKRERGHIIAYHGTPHDFDKFEWSPKTRGTGEGAQVYGDGLYFAENEGVAKSYRDNLSGRNEPFSKAVYQNGDKLNWYDVPKDTREALALLSDAGGDLEKAKRSVETDYFPKAHDRIKAALDRVVRDGYEMRPHGSMYEVRIKADPEHFLDWDKPLSEQSEAVRRAADRIFDPGWNDGSWTPRGEDLVGKVDKAKRSQIMREAGVPGIKFLDAGSRGVGDGTRNFVVFDDSLIEITRKYSRGGSRNERIAEKLDALAKAIDSIDDPAAFNAALGRLSAGGSDVAEQFSREDVQTYGKGARAVERMMAPINPILRAAQRAVPYASEIMQRLYEDTSFKGMHFTDKTLGPSAETLIREVQNGAIITVNKAHAEIYSEMRKAGVQMTQKQFSESIAKAMRRNDVGENEFVTKAAQAYRKDMFDKLLKEAQATNKSDGQPMLPADVKALGADSYLTRMPNRPVLVAREQDFKADVAGYMNPVLQKDYAESVRATKARLARLDQEKADLMLSPEARAAKLETIDAKLAEMETTNAREIDLLAQINKQQTIAANARERGDRKAMKAAKEESARLYASGGDTLKAFMKERGALRSQRGKVDLNYAGLQERSDKIAQTIADIEESAIRQMTRLIDRGRKAEREFAKLDPQQKVEKVASLRTMFADVTARSEKAADQLAERARAIAAEEMAALQKAIKERQAGGMKAALAGTTEAKAATKADESRKALAEAINKNAKAERARADRLNSITRRLEEAEALDPDAQIIELRRALDEMAAEVSGRTLDKGARAQRLIDRAKNLDPAKLDARVKAIDSLRKSIEDDHYQRWAVRKGGENVDLDAVTKPDFSALARDIADQAFDFYTGRGKLSGTVPDFAMPLTSGPMKERTLPVPDTILEPYLENDITTIARHYARTMASQIEMTRKFGRADMADQQEKLKLFYRDLRAQVSAASSAEEATAIIGKQPGVMDAIKARMRGEDRSKVTKEGLLNWLTEDEKGALEDMITGRDQMLNKRITSDYDGIVRNVAAFNYITKMGGALIANLSDIYRPAMVHGLGRFMSDGIKPLIQNVEAFREVVKEAHLAGIGEKWLNAHTANLGELADPYAKGSPFDNLMQNASKAASVWNGLAMFTNFEKDFGSVVVQARILKAAQKGDDKPYMRMLGIDPFMQGRIAEQFAAHGTTMDGVRVAKTEDWTDAEAVRAYRAAISKDVSTQFNERSAGDVAHFFHTPLGRLVGQFRTFNLAANQRILMRGLQDSPAQLLGSIVAMTSIGMLVSTLRSFNGGADRWEKFKDSASNPGFLIGEGLDNSGIFSLFFEGANTIEKFTQPSGIMFNPIKTPLMAAFPNQSQQGESARFAARDPLSAVLGPTASIPMAAARALSVGKAIATGEDVRKGDLSSLISQVPFGSYIGPRQLIQHMVGDSPYDF